MNARLEQIAAKIRATGKPLESCMSNPFADGFSYTVWFERLSPQDVVALRRMLGEAAAPLSAGQHRAIAEAEAGATSRRSRRR